MFAVTTHNKIMGKLFRSNFLFYTKQRCEFFSTRGGLFSFLHFSFISLQRMKRLVYIWFCYEDVQLSLIPVLREIIDLDVPTFELATEYLCIFIFNHLFIW